MARATAHIARDQYATQISVAGRQLVADEPPANGGQNAGPAPYDLLLASLSACTAITLRMYADHKGWPLEAADVTLHFFRDEAGVEFIDRQVAFSGALNETQVKRLLEVCERTPVTKTLKQGLTITTTLKTS